MVEKKYTLESDWVLIIGHVAPVMLQLGIFKKELRNICMFMELL